MMLLLGQWAFFVWKEIWNSNSQQFHQQQQNEQPPISSQTIEHK
jgi:hypothetical protein